MIKRVFFSFFLFFAFSSSAQVVYEPVGNPVYSLLDELANQHLIDLNTVVKPYSRKLIADKLYDAKHLADIDTTVFLTKRQRDEIDFYLRDFGKELNSGKNWDRRRDLLFHDSENFQITLNPIIGGSVFMSENSEGNDINITRYIGASFFGRAGKKAGFYANLKDFNYPLEYASLEDRFSPDRGGNFKFSGEGSNTMAEFMEMKGGITWDWNWGHIGLIKDHFEWGNNYGSSNIISDRAPGYFFLDLQLSPVKWLDFYYIHGWLNSELVDSSRTYLTPHGTRRIFHNKNLASNLITFKLPKKINFSLGNSIVYSDNGIQPVYFIPFMFFKALDHDASGAGSNEVGQNSQVFFDLSIRSFKKLHLYTSWFLDELNIRNIFDPKNHTNLWSIKTGARISGLIPNTILTAEYTRTNPWTYRHQISTTTYESNGYNLGHYLGENSNEILLSASVKPFRGLWIDLGLRIAEKGAPHEYQIINGNANVTGLDFMSNPLWKTQSVELDVRYEVINGGLLFARFIYNSAENQKAPVPIQYSRKTFMEAGMKIGF